jgi:hypothetical protein
MGNDPAAATHPNTHRFMTFDAPLALNLQTKREQLDTTPTYFRLQK